MKKNELKPCPFCGGKAEMRKGGIISDTLQITCTKCKVATQEGPLNFPMSDGKIMTEEMAKDILAWIWNRRVSEE